MNTEDQLQKDLLGELAKRLRADPEFLANAQKLVQGEMPEDGDEYDLALCLIDHLPDMGYDLETPASEIESFVHFAVER
jgi:hypothetical protein